MMENYVVKMKSVYLVHIILHNFKAVYQLNSKKLT